MANKSFNRIVDGMAAGSLVVALLLVYVVDRPSAAVQVTNDLQVRVVSSTKEPTSKLRLGVTPTQRGQGASGQLEPWDDMGKLLNELGKGYAHEIVTTEELLKNHARIKDFDVLFLTCAPGGLELQNVLRNFVSGGGTLYASDFRFDALAAAFPDVVDKSKIGAGAAQSLEADVVDPGLREVVGPKIHLRFDLGEWKTAAFSGERVTTLVQGNYRKQKTAKDTRIVYATAPLLVRFSFGRGTVIFTSFHNEKQNSEIEKKLLQYLVFSLVTAQVDYQVTSSISQDGFAPQKSNLLSSPGKNLVVSKEYTTQKAGSLRFALGFRNEGAKLRLTIESPEGKSFGGEFTSTAIVEVPSAPAGVWKYTVEALELPYENFPFTVTVGEKK